MRFRAVIELNGKTATGIEVPAAVLSELPGKHPKVRVTIGDCTYPSSVASMGGRFLIPVSAEVRAKAGVAAGDEIDVALAVDDEPRTLSLPPDLIAALDSHPTARSRFDALSYSLQRRHVLAIEGAKSAETRRRRIDKAITDLEGAVIAEKADRAGR
jgi:Bacteriocin-protection, YdeI or OmpD-Associated/Domain of unknown function (DUF1905)